MIKKLLHEITLEEVISFEKSQVAAISTIMEAYNEQFSRFDCNLECVLYRMDKKDKIIEGDIDKHDLVNGYMSHTDIFIKRDGSYLELDLPDDDDDNGILAINNNAVNITRGFIKVYVTMCDDISHIHKEIDEYLMYIKEFGVKKLKII